MIPSLRHFPSRPPNYAVSQDSHDPSRTTRTSVNAVDATVRQEWYRTGISSVLSEAGHRSYVSRAVGSMTGGMADKNGSGADDCGASLMIESTIVSTRSLRVGMQLAQDIYAETGVLLLARGAKITPCFLTRLSDRNIHTVVLRPHQAAETLRSACADGTDRLRELPQQAYAERSSNVQPQLSLDGLTTEAQAGLKKHAVASGEVARVGQALVAGNETSATEIDGIVGDFVNMIALDKDLLSTIVALQVPQHEYLFDHCVNTAVLSLTLGNAAGLDCEQLLQLGTGALLADVGMLRVSHVIRFAKRPLKPDERSEMQRHPFYTCDLLERIEGLPAAVRVVASQVHERLDGSGYPRRRSHPFIHEYARIAAIADVFAALTHPRPHRPAKLPHAAVRHVLNGCSKGRLDSEFVRTFLDTVGLFPIRSLVELNSGLRCVVIRTNPGLHALPVVAELDSAGRPSSRVIDLSTERDLSVNRAIEPFADNHWARDP